VVAVGGTPGIPVLLELEVVAEVDEVAPGPWVEVETKLVTVVKVIVEVPLVVVKTNVEVIVAGGDPGVVVVEVELDGAVLDVWLSVEVGVLAVVELLVEVPLVVVSPIVELVVVGGGSDTEDVEDRLEVGAMVENVVNTVVKVPLILVLRKVEVSGGCSVVLVLVPVGVVPGAALEVVGCPEPVTEALLVMVVEVVMLVELVLEDMTLG
jgi:hypothetical protein